MKLALCPLFLCALLSLSRTLDGTAAIGPNTTAILDGNAMYHRPGAAERMERMKRWVHLQNQCNVNVCFALDGSRPVTREQYTAQKEFVQLVGAVIGVDPTAALAAVRYGAHNTKITKLTHNIKRFLKRTDRSNRFGFFRAKSAGAGLGQAIKFCMRNMKARTEDANKIVILEDGRSVIDDTAVKFARKFVPPVGRGSVCAVGVGVTDRSRLQALTGNPSKVLTIDEYFDLLDIIEKLVKDICLTK